MSEAEGLRERPSVSDSAPRRAPLDSHHQAERRKTVTSRAADLLPAEEA